jgi:hypothetical protein
VYKKLLVVALVVGIGGFAVLQTRTAKTAEPRPTNSALSTKPALKQSVQVVLPGAKPIPVLTENYVQPASLWVVVSKVHPLTDAQYVPSNLIVPAVKTRTDKSTAEQSLRADIEPDAVALFKAARQRKGRVVQAHGTYLAGS